MGMNRRVTLTLILIFLRLIINYYKGISLDFKFGDVLFRLGDWSPIGEYIGEDSQNSIKYLLDDPRIRH